LIHFLMRAPFYLTTLTTTKINNSLNNRKIGTAPSQERKVWNHAWTRRDQVSPTFFTVRQLKVSLNTPRLNSHQLLRETFPNPFLDLLSAVILDPWREAIMVSNHTLRRVLTVTLLPSNSGVQECPTPSLRFGLSRHASSRW